MSTAGAAGQHLRGAHRRPDPRLGAEPGPGARYPGLLLRTVSGCRRGGWGTIIGRKHPMGSPPPKPFYPYLHVLSEGGREERSKGRLERPWGAKARCSGQFPVGKRAQSDGPGPTRAGGKGKLRLCALIQGPGWQALLSSAPSVLLKCFQP